MRSIPYVQWTGVAGVSAGDVIYTFTDAWKYRNHVINATAGTVSFEATVDGSTWFAIAAHEVDDVTGSTTETLTSAKAVTINGRYLQFRVKQSGVPAANAQGFSEPNYVSTYEPT